MRFLPGNAQHIGARHSQQDSFGFSDPNDEAFLKHGGLLAIVCDGMGGMEFGDEASRLAVKVFLEAYARKTPEETIPAALERSVHEANAQVVALSKKLGLKDGIGTTLVAAALCERHLYFISVGDSGVFLCAPGEYRMINHPHVFANVLDAAVARGKMSREDAQTHPERESLTSYIGTEKMEEIDANLEPYVLHDGDTVLLASDGMFKTLAPEEIRACLAGDAQRWPEILVAQTISHQREYQDNVTVVSVTASEVLQRTMTMRPAADVAAARAVAPAAASSEAASSQPALSQPPSSQPAMEWPSGEHPVVPAAARTSPWFLILAALVVIAAGVAGWWYVTYMRPAHADPPKKIDLSPATRPASQPEPAGAGPDQGPGQGPGPMPGQPGADPNAPQQSAPQDIPALPPPINSPGAPEPGRPDQSKARKP